jgi:intracellular multiplication protein IcmX
MQNTMKGIRLCTMLTVLFISSPSFAQDETPAPPNPYAQAFADQLGSGSGEDCQGIKCLRPIADYIKRMGAAFGFNIGETPNPDVKASLLDREPTSLSGVEHLSVFTYLGAIPLPISLTDKSGIQKLPLVGTEDPDKPLNKQAGNTFYKVDGQHVKLAIPTDEQTNQKPLQADPLNQNLLTLISTPPGCAGIASGAPGESETCVDRQTILDHIFLTDSMSNYYKNKTNENPALVSKLLNSNALITPMVLMTDENTEAAKNNAPSEAPAFESASSAQNATQFIQYVSGINIPLDMPPATVLTEKGGDHRTAIKLYTALVRTYAARLSVGLGNLYYILSKRIPQEVQMPQTSSEEAPTKEKTSQALMEYKMSTWRLFNSDADPSAKQWIEKINAASPATIQKEMAMLLAEINYQLYLTREQQERLLLTNSVLLLISTNTVPPTARDLEKELAK